MFELNEATVNVVNVNHRPENHGDKKKLAFDLKVVANCHASALDNFDGLLRQLYYRAPGAGEQQRLPVEGVDLDKLTELRSLRLAPLKWDEDYPGYKMAFTSGLGLTKPVLLDQVKLSSFTFEPLDGGSVEITFRASGLEAADSKIHLPKLLLAPATLTLTPPAPAEWPQPGDQLGDLAADNAERVLVTGCEFKTHKGNHLTTTTVTLSDARVLKLDPVAYVPDEAQVIDLIKFNHGFNAEFTPALRDELWPAKAA